MHGWPLAGPPESEPPMAASQTISDLSDLIDRIGQDRVTNQATWVQNTVALALPMEEDYEVPAAQQRLARPISLKKGMRGKHVVNVSIGGTGGLGSYDDGQARPTGSGRPVSQGEKLPGIISETLLFTLAEVDIADGHDDQTVNKVEKTLKAHGSQFGAYMARALIDPSVDAPTADVAAGTASMVVQDASGYTEGQRFEVRNNTSGTVTQEFIAALVAPVFGGGATVTFEAVTTALLDVSDETIYLKGQGALTDAKHLGSFKDFTDSTLDMYGLSRATVFPSGIYQSVAGAFSNTDGKEAHSALASRCNPTHWHTSPRGGDRIENAQGDNVRFIPGVGAGKRDPFADAMVQEYCGLPVIRCPQALDSRITIGDFDSVELREHVPYAPRRNLGVEKGEWGRGALRESEELFAFKILMDGRFSMVTDCRRNFLTLDNITS